MLKLVGEVLVNNILEFFLFGYEIVVVLYFRF